MDTKVTEIPTPSRSLCCVPACQEHPSWLRPVTERRSYPAGLRGRVAA